MCTVTYIFFYFPPSHQTYYKTSLRTSSSYQNFISTTTSSSLPKLHYNTVIIMTTTHHRRHYQNFITLHYPYRVDFFVLRITSKITYTKITSNKARVNNERENHVIYIWERTIKKRPIWFNKNYPVNFYVYIFLHISLCSISMLFYFSKVRPLFFAQFSFFLVHIIVHIPKYFLPFTFINLSPPHDQSFHFHFPLRTIRFLCTIIWCKVCVCTNKRNKKRVPLLSPFITFRKILSCV